MNATVLIVPSIKGIDRCDTPISEERVMVAGPTRSPLTRSSLRRSVAAGVRHVPCAWLLLAGTACAAARTRTDMQDEPPIAEVDTGSFVLKQGATTVASERFVRTDGDLNVDMALPNGMRATYTVLLRPDASVARIDVRQYAPGAAANDQPMVTSSGAFEGDTVLLSLTLRDSTQTARRATVRGVVPYINPSPSAMEQIVRRAKAIGGTRTEVPIWIPNAGGQNATAIVEWTAPGAAELTVFETRIVLQVDPQGRITGGFIPGQELTLVRTAGAPPPQDRP